MVDATGFGTIIIKARNPEELEVVLDAMIAEDNLVLARDLNFSAGEDHEMLEEGCSCALINEEYVKTKAEAREESAKCGMRENGNYKKSAKLAFVRLSAVQKSCGEIVKNFEAKDKVDKAVEAKKAKAARKAELREALERGEIRSDDEELIDSDAETKQSYALKQQEWVVPETSADDSRRQDEGVVSGGAPQRLEAASAPGRTTGRTTRDITKYSTGEYDNRGVQKVYIEEPEVVGCDESQIHVKFSGNTQVSSYAVRVEAASGTFVLGPIATKAINPDKCQWRLSKGKRLTISLVRTYAAQSIENPRGPEPGMKKKKIADPYSDYNTASAKKVDTKLDEIAKLEASKLQALAKEDFLEADRLKAEIARLKVGHELELAAEAKANKRFKLVMGAVVVLVLAVGAAYFLEI